jgi:hypothetical protein
MGRGLDLSGSGEGQAADCCESCNEPTRFHKTREIFFLFVKILSPKKGLCSRE